MRYRVVSFWVAEQFGIAKWQTLGERVTLISADAIVDGAKSSISRIKAQYVD